MTAEEFLSLFPRRRQNSPTDWHVPCPAHDDNVDDPAKFSLHVTVTADRILLKCFAGCDNDRIGSLKGFTAADLFLRSNGSHAPREEAARPEPTPTLAAFAQLKQIKQSVLEDDGWRNSDGGIAIPYLNRDGSLWRMRYRHSLRPGAGFKWDAQKERALIPYGRHRLDQVMEKGELWLVEGESDAVTAWARGLPCLGLPGNLAVKCLTAEDFRGIETVWILKEPGQSGIGFATQMREHLPAIGYTGTARLVTLPAKDLSDLHVLKRAEFWPALRAAQEAADDLFSVAAPAVMVDASTTPYLFTPAFPADHFVSFFIRYGAECVDAAHEFLETTALILLATATPGVRARLRQYPRGLPTAFYAINIGESTRSRKSSVAGLGLDLLSDAIPDCRLAEQSSPEAFIEQLAGRKEDGALWYVDEIAETIDGLTHRKHLSALRGLLLELYEGRPYRYKRTTKRTKAGTPVGDEMVIDRPHLSVLGSTTPAIFEIVSARDITSGFLARFAITMPTGKPPRRGLEEPTEDLVGRRAKLATWLRALHAWTTATERRVQFTGDALAIVDQFDIALESSGLLANERSKAMLQRLNALTVKVSMLAAAGRVEATEQEALVVTPGDARAAVQVATRWRDAALAFGQHVGENELEQVIGRALRVVQAKRTCPRRTVAQLVHVTKRTLDEIESTLIDRGDIEVNHTTRAWTWIAP